MSRALLVVALTLSLASLALAIASVLILGTRSLRVEVFEIESRCSLVIAHVSDLHVPSPSPPLDEILGVLKEVKPDIIAFTGDYVSRRSGLEAFAKFLEGLRRELPSAVIVGCLGNWDLRLGVGSELAKEFSDVRGYLLVDSYVVIDVGGCRVCIAGLDDALLGNPDYGVKCPSDADVEIALVHEPRAAIELAKAGFEGLVLAGHCHGGQIRVFNRPVLLPPACSRRFYEGIHAVGKATIVVSPGIGTSVVPIRLGCPPTIYVIKLVKKAG